MLNPDGTTHPATFQPDICDQLTPATVAVWLRRQAVDAIGRGDITTATGLCMSLKTVERLAGTRHAAD